VICETCSGARFSEEGYPHHLTEMDECLCDEAMRQKETNPVTDEERQAMEEREHAALTYADEQRARDLERRQVTDEARAMLERLEGQLSPMRYRLVCREALEMARGEVITGWLVASALESVRTHRQ
jgi:hypothetical protein